MAIETLRSHSLDHAVEFINDSNNDVHHVWIFKNYVYLGSFLPKVFGKINYDLEQISIMLYIKKDERLCEETVVITKDDFFKYTFNYL